jgi:hypothetical protein
MAADDASSSGDRVQSGDCEPISIVCNARLTSRQLENYLPAISQQNRWPMSRAMGWLQLMENNMSNSCREEELP